METWIWVVVALLVGALLGGLGVFLVARRRWADAVRSEELQRQLDEYRRDVGDHFVETAELVNNLTRSYKAVYDHLEQGAYRLVDEETLRKQLGDVDAESVRLEYIGRRNRAAVLGSGTGAGASVPEGADASHERGTAEERPASTEEPAARSEPGEDARDVAPDDAPDASVADQSAWTRVSTSGSAAGEHEAEGESAEGETVSDEPGEDGPTAEERAARTDGPLQ